jgi:signal transduction histidine kinase
MNFAAPENVLFRYRLLGWDDKWSAPDRSRDFTFSRLPAGSYEFQVTACNDAGIWSSDGARLAFEVTPFLWQHWWFKLGGVLAFAGLIGTSVRFWSNRRLQHELELLKHREALEKERARIARDLHDDLGSSLTQVGLLLEELRENLPATEPTQTQAAGLSNRVRSLARDLDAVVWTVNPRKDSLHELAGYIGQFFLESFRATRIRPRLDIAEGLPAMAISPEVRHHLFLAAKEAFNNVIKHSQASEVKLKIGIVANELELKLEDNGSGFRMPEAETSKRHGLKNLRSRVEELQGRLELTSDASMGTCVRLVIPLGKLSDTSRSWD